MLRPRMQADLGQVRTPSEKRRLMQSPRKPKLVSSFRAKAKSPVPEASERRGKSIRNRRFLSRPKCNLLASLVQTKQQLFSAVYTSPNELSERLRFADARRPTKPAWGGSRRFVRFDSLHAEPQSQTPLDLTYSVTFVALKPTT